MNVSPQQAIGIFDSGLGGLTVANAIKSLLPNENLFYFGDTAHLPYGDKSQEAIRHFSLKITDYLLLHQCKVILIACNSASSAAYEIVKNHVAGKALVINVIDPVIESLKSNSNLQNIGVIGTKATIQSGAYQQKLSESLPQLTVSPLATPLFVPMIEEGFIYDDISNAIIRAYLSRHELKGIDALILGCTHYPLIKNQIRKFYDFHVKVIDSSQIVASKLKEILEDNGLLNKGGQKSETQYSFQVSDYTEMFQPIAQMFFDEQLEFEKVDIWG